MKNEVNMIKKFCDCCGKEIIGQSMPIEVPCHHYSLKGNVSSSYVDKDWNHVSGRYEKIDLCNACSNEIFSCAVNKFEQLKKNE
ncbi:MAG: hypothetical protein AB7V16_07135 [Vulcanibacillus sp.]